MTRLTRFLAGRARATRMVVALAGTAGGGRRSAAASRPGTRSSTISAASTTTRVNSPRDVNRPANKPGVLFACRSVFGALGHYGTDLSARLRVNHWSRLDTAHGSPRRISPY